MKPPGEARTDWKIIRALSEIAGKALPYDDIKELRSRLSQIAPHLVRFGEQEKALFCRQAASLSSSLYPSQFLSASLVPAQKSLADFYQTNSVTRASPTMAAARAAALRETSNEYAEIPKHHAHA